MEENKKFRQELLAAKAGGAGGAEKEPEPKEDDTDRPTGIPGVGAQLAHYETRVFELLARKRTAKPVTDQLKDLEAAIERRKKALEKARASHTELLEEQKTLAARIAQAEDDKAKAAADVERMEGERARLYQTRVDESAAAASVDLTIKPDKIKEAIDVWLGLLGEQDFQRAGDTKAQSQDFVGKLVFALGLAPGGGLPAASSQAVPQPQQQ